MASGSTGSIIAASCNQLNWFSWLSQAALLQGGRRYCEKLEERRKFHLPFDSLAF
jgi:hypothetical protein